MLVVASLLSVCVCVCVCACARARVHACVRACHFLSALAVLRRQFRERTDVKQTEDADILEEIT
jgi:hypothetical protein